MAASFPSSVKSFSAIVNGVTKLVASLFNSPYDEITAIETELGANMSGVRMGAWVDKTASYAAQQATTDGFVVGYGTITGGSAGTLGCYTDGNSNPTTLRQYFSNPADWNPAGAYPFCMPVKKNDYWKIVVSNCTVTAAYWIPLGG